MWHISTTHATYRHTAANDYDDVLPTDGRSVYTRLPIRHTFQFRPSNLQAGWAGRRTSIRSIVKIETYKKHTTPCLRPKLESLAHCYSIYPFLGHNLTNIEVAMCAVERIQLNRWWKTAAGGSDNKLIVNRLTHWLPASILYLPLRRYLPTRVANSFSTTTGKMLDPQKHLIFLQAFKMLYFERSFLTWVL